MLAYIVNHLYCNFMGTIIHKCTVPISNNPSLVRYGTLLCDISPSARLQLSHNNEGLIAFVRSSLNTNTCVVDVTTRIPCSTIYSAITDNISSDSIIGYMNNIMSYDPYVYSRVIAYTLYSYSNDITKQIISDYLEYTPINIGKKPTLIEQLNAIPLEHKLPWFDASIVSIHNDDLSSLFDGYEFQYELAVVVLEALAIKHSGTRKGSLCQDLRICLDTSDIVSIDHSNIYGMQILIDAVDRRIISIDDLTESAYIIATHLCQILNEYRDHPLLYMELHKLIALVLSVNYKSILLHNFIADDCEFCMRIPCDKM